MASEAKEDVRAASEGSVTLVNVHSLGSKNVDLTSGRDRNSFVQIEKDFVLQFLHFMNFLCVDLGHPVKVLFCSCYQQTGFTSTKFIFIRPCQNLFVLQDKV